MSSIKDLQPLEIPLQDIKSATNNFGDTNLIGRGGFGNVYRGELVISEKLTMVAVKRLDSIVLGQRLEEFLTQIMFLSRYKHKNLVSLLGYCEDSGEKILVYEYLSNKSLDLHLSSSDLSWNQRLHICIGAARGLQYLHHPLGGSQHRVLHRDIKSANILLDHDWNAKLSDFGLLTIFFPANHHQSTLFLIDDLDTMCYTDPEYTDTGIMTKESDVYSMGVVFFEVLCGRHCLNPLYEDERRYLTTFAIKCYKQDRLDTIIDDNLIKHISPSCLDRFSKVAYQCLRQDPKDRPSATELLKELEIALEYQLAYEKEKEKEKDLSGYEEESDSDEGDFWETKLPQDWTIIITKFCWILAKIKMWFLVPHWWVEESLGCFLGYKRKLRLWLQMHQINIHLKYLIISFSLCFRVSKCVSQIFGGCECWLCRGLRE